MLTPSHPPPPPPRPLHPPYPLQFEPKHRLVLAGMDEKKKRSRKQWKDSKRKLKRTWGTGRRAAARAQKLAAAS